MSSITTHSEAPAGTSQPYDVAIVGGGLVGCSLAVALRRQGRRVVLIEAQPPRPGSASWDERCIALNAGSREILESLDLWAALSPACEPILSTHISERGRFGAARFSAEQAGLPALGYNTPMRAINDLLWQSATQAQVDILRPASVTGLQLLANSVLLTLETESASSSLHAQLVVAADGARSAVRSLLKLGADEREYGQHAVVTAVRPQFPHAGVAYERFLSSGPLALLPKPDDEQGHACSLVWTLPSDQLETFLKLSDDAFVDKAMDAFGERLGKLSSPGRRMSYPLTRVMSDALTAPRTVFIGNAAQSLHPVAAQGFNLGLRDAATLAALIGPVPDPGDAHVLEAYRDKRLSDRKQVSEFTDRLVRLFSNAVPGLRGLRHLGLMLLEFDSPVRQNILSQNLGMKGSRPLLQNS